MMTDRKTLMEKVLYTSFFVTFYLGAALLTLAAYISETLPSLVERFLKPLSEQSHNVSSILLAPDNDFESTKHGLTTFLKLGTWIMWLPIKLMDMALVVMFLSVCGFLIVKSKRIVLLYMLIGFLSVAVIGQFIFIVNLIDLDSYIHRSFQDNLIRLVQEEYNNRAEAHDSFSGLFNNLMILGECCGIQGPKDFSQTPYTLAYTGDNGATYTTTMFFPLACCRRCYLEQGHDGVMACALSRSQNYINQKGCYTVGFGYFARQYGPAVLCLYVAMTYAELLQIYAALTLVKIFTKEKGPRKGVSSGLSQEHQSRARLVDSMETDV